MCHTGGQRTVAVHIESKQDAVKRIASLKAVETAAATEDGRDAVLGDGQADVERAAADSKCKITVILCILRGMGRDCAPHGEQRVEFSDDSRRRVGGGVQVAVRQRGLLRGRKLITTHRNRASGRTAERMHTQKGQGLGSRRKYVRAHIARGPLKGEGDYHSKKHTNEVQGEANKCRDA